ncbi:MAG: lytic murein transglycosylase [Beijerinckiaceae bacterium]|nr:lytic murein transglycosylase [Beijerinckiaceae bacterium]
MIEFLVVAPFGARASSADFVAFLLTLWPRAREKGVSRATFDAVTGGLTLDSSLPQASSIQPEFDRPLQDYFKEAVSAARIAEGRRVAVSFKAPLRVDEARFGVPGEILLAAWAMESDFGRSRGKRDIFRTLATLAFTRPDRPLFRDEFIEALLILESGQASRAQMTGSWAGAMGDPQFLPSAYRKYAISASGGGATPPDIWSSPPDILASIANFLKLSGWRPDRPWAKEVLLPDRFSVPALHATMAEWVAQGVGAASGALPADGEAALFLPSGADGPAFLLFENHWVLKQYNNSDSYALSLGLLAQRIAGGPALARAWPDHVAILSRTDKAFIQARLAALGLYDGAADGKFGPSSRDAIHAFQRRAGMNPADGFATPALVQRLRTASP